MVRPRQHIAIVLLVLISFQIGGYYGVMEFLKNRISARTADRIAADQTPIGGQLVIRIPVVSDFVSNSDVDLQDHFVFEGKVYQVIERHVYEDMLYVTCIHDNQSTHAQQNIESYAQSLAGKTGDHSAPVKFFENTCKYFFSEEYSWGSSVLGWTLDLQFSPIATLYTSHQQDALFHPPSLV